MVRLVSGLFVLSLFFSPIVIWAYLFPTGFVYPARTTAPAVAAYEELNKPKHLNKRIGNLMFWVVGVNFLGYLLCFYDVLEFVPFPNPYHCFRMRNDTGGCRWLRISSINGFTEQQLTYLENAIFDQEAQEHDVVIWLFWLFIFIDCFVCLCWFLGS